MSAKLRLKGFDEYIHKIKQAGGNVRGVTKDTLIKSAVMFDNELVKQMKASPMSEETKDEIMKSRVEPHISRDTDYIVEAEAGFKLGEYHPKDISGGYVALFNEYGTKKRQTKTHYDRGSLSKMEFTKRAHRKVDSKIRKMQEGILKKALKELEG